MNILHLSDIHFSMTPEPSHSGYKGMIAKMDNPLTHLKECLDQLKAEKEIDLLLISGDLTEDGTSADYAYLKEWFHKELPNVPMVVTLGNHDIKENFYQGWLNQEASGDPYNTVEVFEDFYLISFDNSVYGMNDGHMSESQFEWLKDQLETFTDKPVMLMTHHHLFENQSSTSALPESNKLINLISQYPVHCLLNGHTHHVYTADIKGIQYYTASGMSFVGEDEGNGMVRFDQRYGYNFYQLVHGKIEQQTSENFVTGKVIAKVNMLED